VDAARQSDTRSGSHPEFGAKLKSVRVRRGLSQERAAALVGTSRRQWLRWEGGYHLPVDAHLTRLGEAFGDPELFAEFMDDAEPRQVAASHTDLVAALDALIQERMRANGLEAVA
jgi:transcriptional regulator with XRE-family HTH domain